MCTRGRQADAGRQGSTRARTDGDEGGVEEKEDAEGDEEEAQAQQAHADLLVVVEHGSSFGGQYKWRAPCKAATSALSRRRPFEIRLISTPAARASLSGARAVGRFALPPPAWDWCVEHGVSIYDWERTGDGGSCRDGGLGTRAALWNPRTLMIANVIGRARTTRESDEAERQADGPYEQAKTKEAETIPGVCNSMLAPLPPSWLEDLFIFTFFYFYPKSRNVES